MTVIQISNSLYRWDEQGGSWVFHSGPNPVDGSVTARTMTAIVRRMGTHKKTYLPNPVAQMVDEIAEMFGGTIVSAPQEQPTIEAPERIH